LLPTEATVDPTIFWDFVGDPRY